MAYQSYESGRSEIVIRPFPDVDAGRWQVSTEGGGWPLWNPTGNGELFFVNADRAMTVAVETERGLNHSTPRPLFDGSLYRTDGLGNRRMDVSSDGTRFLMFLEDADTPDPILVQNWTDELQRLVPTP